ncbi:MAG: trigger factor [bacterium]|nr:trigger factor [bacterium]
MKHSIEKLENSQIKISVKLTPEEFQKFIDEELKEFSKEVAISGFRKGKAPIDIIKKSLTKEQNESIIAKATDSAAQDSFSSIINQEKLEILGKPKADIVASKNDSSLDFEILAAIFPEIKLPDFKEVVKEIKRKEIKIEEKEIDSSLDWIRKSRAKFTLKTGPAEKGDWVEIEYKSGQIEGNKNFQDKFILGQGGFVPGFEEAIVGLTSGEEKDFSVVFPKDYSREELAEKEIKFNLKVKNLQKMELPELTDEWAKGLGAFQTIEALKKNIEAELLQEKENSETVRIQEEILEKIREKTKIEIAESLVEEFQDRMLEDFKNRISQQFSADFDSYLKQIKKTEKEIRDSFKELAGKRVGNSLILQEIIKKEELNALPEEIEEKTNEFFKKSPNSLNLGEIDLKNIKSYYKNEIETEKVFKFLQSFLLEKN